MQLGRQRAPRYHHGPNMKPYLRVANVFEDRIDATDVMEMDFNPEEFERYRLRPGDVLLNEGQSPQFLGRPAIYHGDPPDVAFTNSLLRFRAGPAVTPEWALIVFRHHMHSGRFARESRITTNIAHLSATRLKSVEFPVPPLHEQKRIVDALEQHGAAATRTSAALNGLRRQARALQASVARQFLPVDGETTVAIGDIAMVGSGATPARTNGLYYDGGTVPWLTSGDLNQRRVVRARQFVTEKALNETSVRMWPADTLLVAMYGEGQTRGRCARLTFPATTNQACAGIVLREGSPVTVDFLHAFLEANYHRSRHLSAGGVQPNLTLGLVKAIQVPVRPVSTQEAAVQRYEAVVEGLAVVAPNIGALAKRTEALWRSLLRSAFTGGLVESDPLDEPAELLLRRIREDRAAAGSAAGPARKGTVRRARRTSAQQEEPA